MRPFPFSGRFRPRLGFQPQSGRFLGLMSRKPDQGLSGKFFHRLVKCGLILPSVGGDIASAKLKSAQ